MATQAWLRFCRVAEDRGSAPALVAGQEVLSFSGLYTAACGWADLLALEPGERVVISGVNSFAFASAVPGIWARGGIPVFVHRDAPASHLAHACQLTGAVRVLAEPERAGLPCIDAEVVPLVLPEGGQPPSPPPLQSGAEPASIVFTSGSTGLPKGVTQSAATLIDGAIRVASVLNFRQGDRILCPIPFSFDYGWGQLLSTLVCGFTLVLPEPQNSFGLCDALARWSPQVLAGVPALFADLVAGLAPIREAPRQSVRLITSTGSKIPAPVFSALLELFPDASIALNYGLTETYRSASLPTALARSHPTSVGHPMPGVDLAVIREDGTRTAPGEQGEIIHRGAGVFLGYWGDAVRTAQTLRPDPLWPHSHIRQPLVVYTGDLGHTDDEGLLYVHGRRDRQMKSMGMRVSPDEIEAILVDHELVAEAAVVARPHDTLGDLIVALIVPKSHLVDAAHTLKVLKGYARSTMSPAMQPRDWRILETLPRMPSRKVDYPSLVRLVRGADS